jgi:hypothetical protein
LTRSIKRPGIYAPIDTKETKVQLVRPEQIAAVMALMPAPHSFAELDEQVASGWPKTALKAGASRGSVEALLWRLSYGIAA